MSKRQIEKPIRMGVTVRGFVLLAGVVLARMAQAANYWVDASWNGTASGTQTEPYTTIKAAADAANLTTGPHNIYIAGGWYGDVANNGTEDYSAGGGVDGGILLSQRIYIYGGYAGWDGDGTDPGDFDWTEGSRVPRATVIDLTGADSRAFRNTRAHSYQITALYDGLVIQHANHTAIGGAIAHTPSDNNYGLLVINNCFFTNNVTTANGGAVYSGVAFDAQTVTATEFIGNRAADGGAFFENGHACALTFEDCLFRTNTATGHGGAVRINASSGDTPKTSRRCRYESNAAGTTGGAFSYGNNARVRADRTTFVGNTAPSGAATFGRDWWMGSLTLSNCLVTANSGGYAIQADGRVFNEAYPLLMVHCTVVANPNGGVRFADYQNSRRATIRNSIIANNGAYGVYRARLADNDPVLEYNNVYNNTSGNYYQCSGGTGSLSADPKFVNAAAGDYHLVFAGNLCVNAASDAGLYVDLDGNSRPFNEKDPGFDMGCYETEPPPQGTTVLIR